MFVGRTFSIKVGSVFANFSAEENIRDRWPNGDNNMFCDKVDFLGVRRDNGWRKQFL